jgi:hypothetical protein
MVSVQQKALPARLAITMFASGLLFTPAAFAAIAVTILTAALTGGQLELGAAAGVAKALPFVALAVLVLMHRALWAGRRA